MQGFRGLRRLVVDVEAKPASDQFRKGFSSTARATGALWDDIVTGCPETSAGLLHSFVCSLIGS
jgi:hypothetical protein